MDNLKVALVGCGRIGYSFLHNSAGVGVSTHAEAYAKTEGMELVSVADPDIHAAQACAKAYGISSQKIYASPYELLEKERVDIVSIASPDNTHASIAIEALNKKGIRGVFIEKPLALNAEEALKIVQLAKLNSVVVAVNYSRRYCSEHQRIADDIHAGRLGRIQSVNGYYTKGLKHNGTHWLHLLNWFFGAMEPVYTCESGASDFYGDITPSVVFKNEKFKAFLHGCDAEFFSLFEMDIVGSLGRIQIIDGGHRVIRQRIMPSARYYGYSELIKASDTDGHMVNLMLNAVEDFKSSILNQHLPACSVEDAFQVLKMAESSISYLK